MLSRLSIISAAALLATSLFAQGPGRHLSGGPHGDGDFAMVRAEFGISNKVVQGAPYSAQAVTQFTQTLANGDHIQRTTTASVARDSQGRTRVDRSISGVGALSATAGGQGRAIMIHDPVAGVSYALNPASKTGTSTQIRTRSARFEGFDQTRTRRSSAAEKTEDLGTQVIQGLSAQGKRVTRAIAAGQEGNEKEIDIVTETWYSAGFANGDPEQDQRSALRRDGVSVERTQPGGTGSGALRRSIRLLDYRGPASGSGGSVAQSESGVISRASLISVNGIRARWLACSTASLLAASK